MQMGSSKNLSFFQVSNTGWFHTCTKFQNHSDIGWDGAWNRQSFLHVHLDHVQPKSWSQDYTISSGLAIWLQNLNCARTWRTATMPRKYSFQEHWRKDGAYLEWVLKDNLDARYAWCMAFEIQLFFFFFFYYCDAWWSIHNLILVLTSPYKVLIWF